MGGIKTSRDHQRTLLHFPVVHSQKDMGGFSEAIRKVTLQQLGEKVWRRKINLVERFWEEIGKTIDGLALPYEKTLLYQDGLPVCGREREIVFELARKGSPNHRLLQRLV